MLFQGISETFLCYTMSMTQNTCLRGVNLGGWLVLEKWMTPAFFADSDAVDEHTFMQTEHAIEKLSTIATRLSPRPIGNGWPNMVSISCEFRLDTGCCDRMARISRALSILIGHLRWRKNITFSC